MAAVKKSVEDCTPCSMEEALPVRSQSISEETMLFYESVSDNLSSFSTGSASSPNACITASPVSSFDTSGALDGGEFPALFRVVSKLVVSD